MRTLATLLATALLWGLAPAAHAGTTADPYYGRHTGPRPAAIVLGDSTTFHAWDTYRTRGFRGELNGVSMRPVTDLLPLVRERAANHRRVRTAVIALGTNGGNQTFTRDQYATAIRILKRHGARRIVLVTPYRDSSWWDHYRVAQRAGWMRQLADAQRGVCVADWATFAAAHPQALVDGIHYSETAEPTYVAMVLAARRHCR